MSLGIHLYPHGIYACVYSCMVICTLRTWGISDFSIKDPGESKLKGSSSGKESQGDLENRCHAGFQLS